MNYIIFIFPIFFIALWFLVTFIISRLGWYKLVLKFRATKEVEGKRIGIISASINRIRYKNSLIIAVNENGFYLKPTFLFRMFHDPVFIPWSEVKEVQNKSLLFYQYTELMIADPQIAKLEVKQSLYKQMRDLINIH